MNVGDLVESKESFYGSNGIGIVVAMIQDHYFDIRVFFPLNGKSILAPAFHFWRVQGD